MNTWFAGGSAVLLIVCAACGSPSPSTGLSSTYSTPLPAPSVTPPLPTVVGSPTTTPNNLIVRIDSIQVMNDDGNHGLGGEAYVVMLATREFGDSAKLILPGTGSYSVHIGDAVPLGRFSLGINNVHYAENERIAVHFICLESNQQGPKNQMLMDFAITAALEVLSKKWTSGMLVVNFLLQNLGQQALVWWEKEKPLGEYSVVLDQGNNWQAGKQYTVQSTNGNMRISYTVLQGSDVKDSSPQGGEVTLSIVNSSDKPITKLFAVLGGCAKQSGENCEFGKNRLMVEIMPKAKYALKLPVGIYDLRAEDDTGVAWERSHLALTVNQDWTITNNR